jgi:N-acyl-D-aspartate/D-glutamate deacylase
MTEGDMRTFFAQPWVMISSDGGIGMKHPRAAGTYPRVLGRLVREWHWLTLPEAVRRMTSLPAWRLKLMDRGLVHQAMVADLVLFNTVPLLRSRNGYPKASRKCTYPACWFGTTTMPRARGRGTCSRSSAQPMDAVGRLCNRKSTKSVPLT